MDLKKVMNIPGLRGLYKVVSFGRNNNVIVESLLNGSRMPYFSSNHASTLADISIFTDGEDLPLKAVLKRIFEVENGKKTIDVSTSKPAEIEAYMAKILPEYDRDRVHLSDMKKLFSWYNQLLSHDMLSFEEEENAANENSEEIEEKAD